MKLLEQYHEYIDTEYMHGRCLIVFIVSFLCRIPEAILLGYIVLCVVYMLGSLNIILQFEVLHIGTEDVKWDEDLSMIREGGLHVELCWCANTAILLIMCGMYWSSGA